MSPKTIAQPPPRQRENETSGCAHALCDGDSRLGRIGEVVAEEREPIGRMCDDILEPVPVSPKGGEMHTHAQAVMHTFPE